MKIVAYLLFTLGLLNINNSEAQVNFYDTEKIQEVRIYFSQPNWDYLLDSIFLNDYTGRLVGSVTINNRNFHHCGIRYKGFSSCNTNYIKNPFNIDLDYSDENQNYQGFGKLKLSNVIHDPSFIREVLSYEIAGKYMPASDANFANVFINDKYIGLYTNVEAVDKRFAKKHFGSKSNTFFKGDPLELQFPFGQNANLAHTHGNDSSGYMPFYSLESDYGWKDLYQFVYTLNKDTASLDSILDIDQVLWMHAFNYVLLNLDSYIGYAQNYYFYKNDNGRFSPIVWDLNMSFGSFRHSDGSTNFQGVTIPKLKTLDPLQHLSFSISPRPLMTMLFKNRQYRRMYLAHIRTILKENFENEWYVNRGKELQESIASTVYSDTNKFYENEYFLQNFDTTVGGSAGMELYPGIKELMSARINYLKSYTGYSGEPVITDISTTPEHPVVGNTVSITAKITLAKHVVLAHRDKAEDVFTKTFMYDDGLHNDGLAGDSIYGGNLNISSNIVQYYIYAENDTAAVYSPERAEREFHSLQPIISKGNLVINELLVLNNCTKNESGSYSSWLELYNATRSDIYLKGLSLWTSSFEKAHWSFPDTIIPAGKFLIVWLDNESYSTSLHANLETYSNGGAIYLGYSDSQIVDKLLYVMQTDGKSTGRYPNGTGSFQFMKPSFSKRNFVSTSFNNELMIFPNPAAEKITIEYKNTGENFTLQAFNALGEKILDYKYNPSGENVDVVSVELNISEFDKGIYMFRVICGDDVYYRKIMLY